MKRIVLAVALLLGGTAVASADPPGLTPPVPGPAPAPQAPDQELDGGWMGARGPMAQRGPLAERGPRGQRGPMAQRGPRGQRGPMAEHGRRGGQGQRLGRHRLPPRLRARLVQMFDRDGDGRLQGPERRAARRFVRHLIVRRAGGQERGAR